MILASKSCVKTVCELKKSNELGQIYERGHSHTLTLYIGKIDLKRQFKKSWREKKNMAGLTYGQDFSGGDLWYL